MYVFKMYNKMNSTYNECIYTFPTQRDVNVKAHKDTETLYKPYLCMIQYLFRSLLGNVIQKAFKNNSKNVNSKFSRRIFETKFLFMQYFLNIRNILVFLSEANEKFWKVKINFSILQI